ncbi:MAG: PP2C family protein-serine/threonine phosphatase [Terriglobales bacterium]
MKRGTAAVAAGKGAQGKAAEGAEDRRKLATLLRIAKSLAQEIRLQPLLELMVAEVAAAMQAERSTLFLVDPRHPSELVSRVAAPVEQEIRVRIGEGIAGATAESRTAINVADAYRDARFNPAFDRASRFRTRSLLSMPILDPDGVLIGVVQALNRQEGRFTPADEQFLEAICGQLGIALKRAAMVDALLVARMVNQSLEVAREIQAGLVPTDFSALPNHGAVEVFASLTPAYDVGGDLYDVFALDADRVCFMIGDVSGKGIPAALFMAMARTAFKMSALAAPESAAFALRQVNQFLYESNPRQMFVTALAGILDLRSGAVEYADAGHEPPFLVRASGTPARVEKEGGIVLGLIPGQEFTTGRLQLRPGDTLVMFTDGVTEAMNGHQEFFGVERAEQALAEAGPRAGSQAIATALLDGVRRFAGDCPPSDDVTVLAIQYRGRRA